MTYPRYDWTFQQPPPRLTPQHRPTSSPILPWLVVGLVALLVAGGIGLVFLLQDDASAMMADPPTQSDPDENAPVPEPREVPSPPSNCLVECTEAPGGPAPDTGEVVNYAGSEDAAVGFVEAIATGDSVSAHAVLCGAGKSRFATPEELLSDFYATLGITTITGASLTDVYPADSTADAVVFELTTDAGDVVVEVYIVEEDTMLTVCGYDFA